MTSDVHNGELGGIITLVARKVSSSFRLSAKTLDVVQRLADELDLPRADVVEMAVRHLDGTRRAGQPVHMFGPDEPDDDQPKAHKRRRRAA